MYWKETGDLSVWRGIAQDAVIMNTDDLLCIGCVDNILLSSTIGRNKSLIPGEVLKALIGGTEDVLTTMRENGVGILSTGGETADVGDLVRTVIVDSTVTARMKRADVISNDAIAPGDVIVGMESYGQATYESEYNGGMGSNGLTSARHDVFGKYLASKYPESYDAAVPEDLVYSGKYALTDVEPETGMTVGKLVLSPTRTYAPVIKKLLDVVDRKKIHGMVHCSGGAQSKVGHFLNDGLGGDVQGVQLRPPHGGVLRRGDGGGGDQSQRELQRQGSGRREGRGVRGEVEGHGEERARRVHVRLAVT
jgi:phosphoribosylformylglycinamidine cyclo-ligase